MRRYFLTLVTFCLALVTASSQPEITVVQAGLPTDGTVYFLPKTVVHCHLTVERQTYTPGLFARYADHYLHLQGVDTEQRVSHRVTAIDLSAVGVRDTTKCYKVKLKGKSKTTDIHLSDDGILLSVNAEPLRVAGPDHTSALPVDPPQATDPFTLLSRDALKAGSTAKMAELTAQQIQELREVRQQLITGDADEMPQDEQQLRLMLNEIDAQCASLMTLFTGTVRRDTTYHRLSFCPEKDVAHAVLFRLSKRLGLVDADDLSGVPYYVSIKRQDAALLPPPDLKKHQGFYVNVPTMTRFVVSQADVELASFLLPVAQFGSVELRDGGLFKQQDTHMQLHPATGAVVTMTAEAQ